MNKTDQLRDSARVPNLQSAQPRRSRPPLPLPSGLSRKGVLVANYCTDYQKDARVTICDRKIVFWNSLLRLWTSISAMYLFVCTLLVELHFVSRVMQSWLVVWWLVEHSAVDAAREPVPLQLAPYIWILLRLDKKWTFFYESRYESIVHVIIVRPGAPK